VHISAITNKARLAQPRHAFILSSHSTGRRKLNGIHTGTPGDPLVRYLPLSSQRQFVGPCWR
jgi:hypothetical protein